MKNEMLKPLVSRNAKMVLERISRVCPAVLSEEAAAQAAAQANGGRMNPGVCPGAAPVVPLPALLSGVLELIQQATDPKNLSRMEPTWHPWF